MSKFCFKCGKELNENSEFCPWCGQSQTTNVNSLNSQIQNNNQYNVNSLNSQVQNNNPHKKVKIKLPIWAIVLIVIVGLSILNSIVNSSGTSDTADQDELRKQWTDYYEKANSEIVEVQEDILYKYGKYYTNKLVLTTIKIDNKNSESIKSRTSDNDSYFYSFVFDFTDKSEIKGYEEGEYVTIVGTVEKDTTWKTITLKDCHIIKSGDEAKQKYEELKNNQSTHEEYSKKLEAEVAEKQETSAKENKNSYIEKCEILDYTSIQRNPNNFKEKYIKVSGKVIQVSNGWFNSVTLRVEDSSKNVWYVTHTYEENESQIIEGDNIIIYGKSNGVTTYTSILGSSVTIPSIKAEYIDIN